MSTTVLICDTNKSTHLSIQSYLNEANIKSIFAYSGEEALEIIQNAHIDFLILDLMLPKKSGLDVLKEIRKANDIPILCLSIKNSEFDKILALELGADDYVVKPFSPREVAIRVQVILRRIEKQNPHKQISFSNLQIDTKTYSAFINGKALELTPKELHILALFASNPGAVFSRDLILRSIWKDDRFTDARVVDTQIKRIRKKIPPYAKFEIHSVYGVGYKLDTKR